jgi:hypothetical protein
MRSSQITTLFAALSSPRRLPWSIVVSLLLHSAGFALLLYGLRHTPHIEERAVLQRYLVRRLIPPRSELETLHFADAGVGSLGPRAPSEMDAPLPYVLPQDASLPPASQTLVQPDAPHRLLFPQETPIPAVGILPADHIPSISAPPQPATVIELHPSFAMPNHESNLADLRIAATVAVTETPEIAASTTTPVVLHGPEPAKPMLETASLSQPSPATSVSLSDLQLWGTVLIPFANATAEAVSLAPLAPGRPGKPSGEGSGHASNQKMGGSAGAGAGEQTGTTAPGTGSVAPKAAYPEAGQGAPINSDRGSDPGGEASVARISLPKDGQFGVVVVGSSLAEEYPETVAVWNGRLVYTVYLHVGLSKNWILQYSLPRLEEAVAAGSVTRPEAPWPYEIFRPALAPSDYTSDAIMVHGFINLAGRFERLAVVFPSGFAQAKFVLDALRQWQFRAARQNGQGTEVEVLLLIPEEIE